MGGKSSWARVWSGLHNNVLMSEPTHGCMVHWVNWLLNMSHSQLWCHSSPFISAPIPVSVCWARFCLLLIITVTVHARDHCIDLFVTAMQCCNSQCSQWLGHLIAIYVVCNFNLLKHVVYLIPEFDTNKVYVGTNVRKKSVASSFLVCSSSVHLACIRSRNLSRH